jgi:hypothetical protein
VAQVETIKSNTTEGRYAEETAFKTVGGSEVWRLLAVNTWNETRGTFTKVARNPIASDRQRKKGVLVDLDVTAGVNIDLTQYSAQDLLQGVFFANARRKTNVSAPATVNGSNQITKASGLGVFPVGSIIVLRGGSPSAGNSNRPLRVTVSTATALTVAETLVAETLPATSSLELCGIRTGTADIEVDAAGALPTLISNGGLDFTTLNLVIGEHIWIGGDAANTFFPTNDENNCLARVLSVEDDTIVLDKASKGAMVTEAPAAGIIEIYFGSVVLKNEQLASIVRRTYQIERNLGAPDDSQPTQFQSEYLTGCVANEFILNLGLSDKVTCDINFVGADQELRDGATGLKAGTRPNEEPSDAQNTASDLKRVRLSRVTPGNEAPTPLFASFTDTTVTINNGVEPMKKLTNLGAFDMNHGDFMVDVSLEGFFNNIDAISAIRNNDSLTLDMFEFRNSQGWCLDLPLVTAGDGAINIEKDQPMKTPLTLEAASGEEVNAALDHTALISFFNGLPARASTPEDIAF